MKTGRPANHETKERDFQRAAPRPPACIISHTQAMVALAAEITKGWRLGDIPRSDCRLVWVQFVGADANPESFTLPITAWAYARVVFLTPEIHRHGFRLPQRTDWFQIAASEDDFSRLLAALTWAEVCAHPRFAALCPPMPADLIQEESSENTG